MRFSPRALAILVCLLTAACSANRVELRSDAKDVAFRAVGGESLGGSPLVLEGDGLAKARQQDGRLAVQVSAPGYLTREVILDVHGQDVHEIKLTEETPTSFLSDVLPLNKAPVNQIVRELFVIQDLLVARRTDDAQKAVSAFIEKYPAIAAGYVFQANLHLMAGKVNEARLQLLRAKALDGGDSTIQRMLASVEGGK